MLNLHVQPRARAPGVDGLHGSRLRVRLAGPPLDGRANDELVGLLANAFDLPRRSVTIVHGVRGSAKTVALDAPRRLPAWFTALGGVAHSKHDSADDSRSRRDP